MIQGLLLSEFKASKGSEIGRKKNARYVIPTTEKCHKVTLKGL